MILSDLIVKKIEDLLEKGRTGELRVEDGDPLPQEGGGTATRPLQVAIFRRPDSSKDIRIPPTLVDQDVPTTLMITAMKMGEDPVKIAEVIVPAGFHIAGIIGYTNISQEIKER